MCVHVVVWEGGGVEVEVLCSTCTQVTKRDFTSSVARRRTFYESICFAELRNSEKIIRTRLEPFYKKKALCFLIYFQTTPGKCPYMINACYVQQKSNAIELFFSERCCLITVTMGVYKLNSASIRYENLLNFVGTHRCSSIFQKRTIHLSMIQKKVNICLKYMNSHSNFGEQVIIHLSKH